MNPTRTLLLALLPFALAACEQLGFDDPAKAAAMREAEGRAVGSGCRYSGRSLEECYETNRRESKAAIFAGWRDMDGYMRENQIPTLSADGAAAAAAAPAEKPMAPGGENKGGATDKAAKETPAEMPAAKGKKST